MTRSIAYGIVGRCNTEASQKPVPVHRILAAALIRWRALQYREPDDWVLPTNTISDAIRIGASNPSKNYPAYRRENWDSETNWLAHVSAHLFGVSQERGNGVQVHAGTPTTFLVAVHD